MATLAICLAAAAGAGGFSDFFESLFGGRRGASGGAGFAQRGQDAEAEIALTLEEAHRGVKRNITLQENETVLRLCEAPA